MAWDCFFDGAIQVCNHISLDTSELVFPWRQKSWACLVIAWQTIQPQFREYKQQFCLYVWNTTHTEWIAQSITCGRIAGKPLTWPTMYNNV